MFRYIPCLYLIRIKACILTSIKLGGYPENAGPSPAHPGGLSRKDCAIVYNFTDALCFAFRTDNSGPPVNVQVFEY